MTLSDIILTYDHYDISLAKSLLSISSVLSVVYIFLRTFVWKRSSFSPSAPKAIAEDLPLLGAYTFWTKRWTFFQRAIASSLTGNFSFFIGPYPAVGLSGPTARKTFFESKQFGLTEGYGVLFGMFPTTKVEDETGKDTFCTVEFATYFKNRITQMVRKEVIEKSASSKTSEWP
jgi:hypothetical protein